MSSLQPQALGPDLVALLREGENQSAQPRPPDGPGVIGYLTSPVFGTPVSIILAYFDPPYNKSYGYAAPLCDILHPSRYIRAS